MLWFDKHRQDKRMSDGRAKVVIVGACFGVMPSISYIIVEHYKARAWKSVLHCVCNQFADALANDWIIDHRIELVWWKGLL
jgi:hypothetical protein